MRITSEALTDMSCVEGVRVWWREVFEVAAVAAGIGATRDDISVSPTSSTSALGQKIGVHVRPEVTAQ